MCVCVCVRERERESETYSNTTVVASISGHLDVAFITPMCGPRAEYVHVRKAKTQ